MFGPSAHPIFVKNMLPRKDHFFEYLFRNASSVGMISYYMRGARGWQTRVNIYNYFSLLSDSPISAKYEIRCYDRNGLIAKKIFGKLGPRSSHVVDLAQYNELDDFGVVRVYLNVDSNEYLLKNKSYGGVFFTEYYVPGSTQSIYAHSLGTPIAAHYDYSRLGTSLLVPDGFRPFLFIANGCAHNRFLHPTCGEAKITFINAKQKEISVSINPIPPLGCSMIDLFELCPELPNHIGTSIFAIRINGRNILSKPFMFQTKGNIGWGEHL